MSEQASEPSNEMGPTPAAPEHAWLQNLVGEWEVVTEYNMGPDTEVGTSTGKETYSMFGELWVLGEGESTMDDGTVMKSRNGMGFDVSFKEYRSFWVVNMSSHLWKSTGVLSEDGKTMTLTCEGPDMVDEGKTALYRDVLELIDSDHRTLTSFSQGENGEWHQFMKASYTRI